MIFIADLPRNTAYIDIHDFFERNIGPCQICIKRPLFKNFYYAFVMFNTIEDAKRAIEEYRFPRIKGNKMSRSLPYNTHAIRGEPGGKDVQSTSIFVKGFEKMKWTHEDLYAKFCSYGKILSCKVSIDQDHQFHGFGYIQFSKIEEAQKAIQEMDKYDLAGDGHGAEGVLTVLEYQGKKSQISAHKRSFNNVYVKGFPKDSFTEEDLSKLFQEFGEIQNAAIMRDGNGESKGFGFVCFQESAAAEKATQFMMKIEQPTDKEDENFKKVNGCKLTDLYVREAKKKSQRLQELQMNLFKYKKSLMFFSLFVKNFPPGTTEEELKIYFATACQGEVTKVQILPNTQQAFVNFEKQDQCKTAKEFARNVLFKSQYALYVEYCYPKEMRQIRNEEMYDKRTQERKRNQQTQAQIANMNGTQNLIDLLTILLKPAFQMGSMGSGTQQSRSRSFNPGQNMRPMGAMNAGVNQIGTQNKYINNRTNFQGPNRNMHQSDLGNVHLGHRNNSVGQIPPQQMAPPPQLLNQNMPPTPAMFPQQVMMNQSISQASAGAASAASSSAPQYADMSYAKAYFDEIQAMFMSTEFKTTKR